MARWKFGEGLAIRGLHEAVLPPLTPKIWPVTNEALCNLLGLACALKRHARNQARFSVGAAGEPVQHLGFDWTRRDRVDADTELCPFERRRLRQSFDRVLAGRIHGSARRASLAHGR